MSEQVTTLVIPRASQPDAYEEENPFFYVEQITITDSAKNAEDDGYDFANWVYFNVDANWLDGFKKFLNERE